MSYLRGLNTPRNAPITATAFHPHRMMLACGAVNDGHVNLFKCYAQDEQLLARQGGGGAVGAANGVTEDWGSVEWK